MRLWKQDNPDPLYRRMLGDLLSSALDEANEEFSGRASRPITQTASFLKTLFRFSRDYAQSFARIPKLEKRMYYLLSAAVYELLTKCREQKQRTNVLEAEVVGMIGTLLEEEWLDEDCQRLWKAHNAPDLTPETQVTLDIASINQRLTFFFENKELGRSPLCGY